METGRDPSRPDRHHRRRNSARDAGPVPVEEIRDDLRQVPPRSTTTSTLPASPTTTSSLEEAGSFSALASQIRLDMLLSLSREPKTLLELSGEFGLHRLTLRHHLETLMAEALVEAVSTRRKGTVGRPPVLYRTVRRAHVDGYPPRHFEIFARAALDSLVEHLGDGKATETLRRRGVAMGKQMIGDAAAREGVSEWTPGSFQKVVLDKLYKDFGIPTETIAASDDAIEYRAFGCPFLELATEKPEAVCNGLDRGFHEGVDAALGNVETVRRTCMGHGDAYCEYALKWKGQWRNDASKEDAAKRATAKRK
ncbi:MAG: ArsR family transcriptional regulator [Euryarchaeota archaeon]|nr:ArsR family transcriptional regulator [Euryarchaeota archaeon]